MSGLPIRGVLAVMGAFLINLIFGAYYSFGNIMPYLVAYMRERGNSSAVYRYVMYVSMRECCLSAPAEPLYTINKAQ